MAHTFMLDQTKCPFSASFKIETTEASHNNGAFEFLPSKVSRDISCAKKYKNKILKFTVLMYRGYSGKYVSCKFGELKSERSIACL